MAPVFEEISPVYAKSADTSILTQAMRNAGQPDLMALCDQLRQTVETGVFQPVRIVPGVIDLLGPAEAMEFIDQEFQTNTPKARMLAYSNARVQEYNQHIRLLRNLPEAFIEGEFLVNNTALIIGRGESLRTIHIEREIEVLEIAPQLEKVVVDAGDPNAWFEAYPMTFREVGYKANTTPTTLRVPVSYARVADLMKHYGRQKNWERLFWLKNTFPDFRQRDAATVYKAQGSTYHTVFLDLANIGTCTSSSQIARMLYVGGSRPTTRLCLYGELPRRILPRGTYL